MSDRELDAKVATEVMGLKGVMIDEEDGEALYKASPRLTPYSFVPNYSHDIAAAWLVEERIEELRLIEEYCMHLNEIANAHWDGGKRQPQRWQLIHASPEDRCRAALMAAEAGTGVHNDF